MHFICRASAEGANEAIRAAAERKPVFLNGLDNKFVPELINLCFVETIS